MPLTTWEGFESSSHELQAPLYGPLPFSPRCEDCLFEAWERMTFGGVQGNFGDTFAGVRSVQTYWTHYSELPGGLFLVSPRSTYVAR